DKASLEKLTIGDNQLTVHFEKSGSKQTIRLSQTKPDWKIVFALPKGKYKTWEVNGKKVAVTQEGALDVSGSNGEKIVLDAF
ncbi:MAG TPA: hypothetical protein DCM71_16300, partial [Runella sp.]|nr:hypothetical protein [Runella sp.]